MIDHYKQQVEKHNEYIHKQLKKLINLRSETIHLSNDTKALK